MPENAFHLALPSERRSCVVFSSPHGCGIYPESFVALSQLDTLAIRSSEDAFVDDLFACVPEFGAPLLRAGAPRAYIDLNRSTDELDPALIEGARRHGHNPRVASGLGVIPRVVANGRAIYRGRLPMAEAQQRIAQYWHPYHTALQSLLDEAHARHGEAILIDCHSMPHEAMDGVARTARRRPEIVLGDRFGAAAAADVVDRIEAAFAGAGLAVTRNAPFAGAYVTQAYGRPSRNQHAIQVEIDRALYMDEARIRPSANFDAVRELLRGVVAEIAAIRRDDMQLAAE
ncbi:N-formylglutamate amidohydrolase [Seohaeicola zhoushanensis]|uniref:N-formylglutamate amidohydrolase n=1 Tax=Seohaeicola zhoushanensis TaxID=1569283 RepID=A0A8J3GYW4_9RHOB|nr:N-formylglutamate amidohydrolase [Seohaeicola zhoushanensis]GHF54507.1 N-formylglutamate amidohydrolase [Seohaeicola zhoushanensis]